MDWRRRVARWRLADTTDSNSSTTLNRRSTSATKELCVDLLAGALFRSQVRHWFLAAMRRTVAKQEEWRKHGSGTAEIWPDGHGATRSLFFGHSPWKKQ